MLVPVLPGLVLLASALFFLPHRYVFSVVNASRDETLLRLRITEGFEFATRIRHSVQLTPVYEYYRVGPGGGLAVVGTKLQDLGWGMPSTETGRVIFKDGFMEFDGISRALPELRFRVSRINDPLFIMGKRRIDLNAFVGDGELVIFQVRPEPLVYALLRGETDVFQKKTETGAFH